MKTSLVQSGLYSRSDNIVYREMDTSGFLADQSNDRLFHLNETGTAIWNILQTPIQISEILSIMKTAFPDTNVDLIEKDTQNILAKMITSKVITYRSCD